MPSQTGDGKWLCDYCGEQGFGTVEEAQNHEERQCIFRRRQSPGSQGYDIMGPLSAAAPAAAAAAAPSESEPSQSKMRRILLLGTDDRYNMDEADAIACRNLELFEATSDEVQELSRTVSITPGQVGLRCRHCVQSPVSMSESKQVFPDSLFALGSGVRIVAERHLLHCPVAPRDVQEMLEHALMRRRRHQEQGGQQEEEHSRTALLDHCITVCRHFNIVDRYPQRTGIVFADTLDFSPQRSLMSQMGGDAIVASPIQAKGDSPPEGIMMEGRSAPVGVAESAYPFHGYTPREVHGEGPSHLQTEQQTLDETRDASGYPPSISAPIQQGQYPYFQNSDSSWTCRYCSGVHPQFRLQGSLWNAPDPPPRQFIEQHLRICRGYYESMSSTLPMQPYHSAGAFYPQGPSSPPQPSGGLAAYHPSQPEPLPYGGPGPPSWGTPTSYGPSSNYGPPIHSPPPYSMTHHQLDQPYPFPHADSPGMAVPSESRATEESVVPQGRPETQRSTDHAARQAIDYLVSSEMSRPGAGAARRRGRGDDDDEEEELVLAEDKLLLTDYFYHVMKQLQICRFAEMDRKTRGGKRDNIMIGYGGLQCVHCAEAPNARKFFWSNVDRLANSFAEIPGHILKCRRCPNQTKDALRELKSRHSEQMSRLPRGSQKVFFRRMWRRVHDKDPKPPGTLSGESKEGQESPTLSQGPTPISTAQEGVTSPPGSNLSPSTSGEESAIMMERPTEEAAKALAASLTQSSPPSPSSRVMLAVPEDKEWLSDMDCFVRRNLEVFCATEEDVGAAQKDRKYPVVLGQVGIRCIHCALARGIGGVRGHAVAYPYSIGAIYESVREFQRVHLDLCPNLPKGTKSRMEAFKGASSLSSVLRKYYVLAAKALGLHDTPDGIRSGAQSEPLGPSAAFAFSESESKVSAEMQSETDPSMSMKRKAKDEPAGDEPPLKRSFPKRD